MSKKICRLAAKKANSCISQVKIDQESTQVCRYILGLERVISAQRIGVFLSMQGEISTRLLLIDFLSQGKLCYVPRCDGVKMEFLKVLSMEDIESLPPNAWGIPEPLPLDDLRQNAKEGGLDLIIMPGLAFDRTCNRIGYGKGYYDKYLEMCQANQKRLGLNRTKTGTAFPKLVAIGLSTQLIANVPTDKYDIKPDLVVLGGPQSVLLLEPCP